MKLKIKYIPRNNCYITLPESFLASENFSLDYSKGQISRAIQLKNLDGKKIYLSFNGSISQEEGTLGISEHFGICLDLLEGDIVEPKIESSTNKTKDVDLYCQKSEDYQAITLNREGLERGLLNQISVLYDGVKFPVYYNEYNSVVLTYKSKGNLPHACIATDAKVNILCLEEEKKVEDDLVSQRSQRSLANGAKQNVGKIDFRVRVRHEAASDLSGENYFYIDEETAQRYGFKEEKLYKVHVKNSFWRKKEKSFGKYARYYRKVTNTKSNDYPNPKKLDYSFLTYLKIENNRPLEDLRENSQPYLCVHPARKLAARLSRQDELQIDPDEDIKDFTSIRRYDIKAPLLQKITIAVYVLHNESPNAAKHIRERLLEQLKERIYQEKKEILLISNQLFKIENYMCLMKITERTPEKKFNEIEMLKITKASGGGGVNANQNQNQNREDDLDGIVEVKSDVRLEEIGLSIKRFEKMLKKFTGSIDNKETVPSDFYRKEVRKGCEILRAESGNTQVLLVAGPKKSGKSNFIKRLKKELQEDFYWSNIDFKEFISAEKDIERFSLPLIKKFIEYKFETISLRERGILAFENIHLLCKHLERIDPMNAHEIIISESLSSTIAAKIKTFERNKLPVHFVFTAEGESFLHASLKKKLTDQIALKSLDVLEKKDFVKKIFSENYIDPSPKSIEEIIELTEYMNLNSFILLNKKVESNIIFQKGVTYKELDEPILQGIIISSIKDIAASTTKNVKTELSFKEIGGMNQVKTLIQQTFQDPLKYSVIFKDLPTKLPRGILLYGPSGCGKTMIAAGASVDLKMNFLSVKGPELLNKYIGASEQAVRDIFEKASAQTPCIIFFDEFDSIVPRRNSGSTGVTDRVVNQFLTYLDGVTEVKDVFILAATSRPDLIDPALLRPGRIDKHVFCGYPNKEERLDILNIYTKTVDMEGVDLELIAENSQGFSGADISAMVKNAQIKAVHNLMEETKNNPDKPKPKELIVSMELFDQAFQETRKSVNPKNEEKALKTYSNFIDKGADMTQQKQTLY